MPTPKGPKPGFTNPNLTAKQLAFIEAWAGNGTEAAKAAGYKHPRQAAAENLRKDYILEAIKQREKERENDLIATREERQRFWTAMFRDELQDSKDRLKASELLGRSEADFIERMHHTGSIRHGDIDQMSEKEKLNELEHLKDKL